MHKVNLFLIAFSFITIVKTNAVIRLPKPFLSYIQSVKIDRLANNSAEYKIKKIDDNTLHISLKFNLKKEVRQDDWEITIKPAFTPTYHWSPHLTPLRNHVVDQQVFRTPALIAANASNQIILIPDLNILKKGSPANWYMDIDAVNNTLTLGMSNTRVSDHVLFEKKSGAIFPKGEIEFGFYLLTSDKEEVLKNPFRKVLELFWHNWGRSLYQSGYPVSGDLLPYVRHTYHWAFSSWKKHVWQEFSLNGKTVGAPVFIVNTTQSPNYQGEVTEREFRSIWNQAWFNSLRSASGLYRYARRISDKDLMQKALMTKELALSFPKKEGFFYGLIGTDMHQVNIDGKFYNRSSGWEHYYWGNSNRNPYTSNPKESPFHVLDMSFTALLMLRWYEELEPDDRLLAYSEDYAQALIKKQYSSGFFPAWLDENTMRPMSYLNDSPESSMSATFLLKLYQLTGNKTYKNTALKTMKAVMDSIIPTGRWEDFETYWSCCRIGTLEQVGKKYVRNNMYKQNNFSMFWTAEALLESFKATGDSIYLFSGQRVLDEMLMFQASWQPPYIYVNAFGGFGVLNADGEWNDSRGSLFSELIIQFGKLLNKTEYIERGISALRSSFVMMYCPENPRTKELWEKVWPFFNSKDYGFTMENYGHGGISSSDGEGMGEFTIYDWGNGAASEAYNRIIDRFGEDILKTYATP